ncbi:hypothetical protein AWW72_07955 [Acinetobacter sp. NRRL B-65365]|uniref:GtrA family protein n=1 Tax=Acinetobacter sp. NRRL B-65365 TaxID=1785092 RepID=UPI0007A05CB8|nr:GtrA family protein [Acinetobacter sp. NRRL B-65365]KYQ84574.1 hypothetical protein AWW72_07955 [Acinetobacter sp. NRRL B-65365]
MLGVIRYGLIGSVNTVIHWVVFFGLYFFDFKQYLSNFIGFFCAVIFSYIINARYNFHSKQSLKNFILFFCLMGGLNLSIGGCADSLDFYPIFTLLVSSLLSLFIGYFLSKYFVFKESSK